MHFVRFFVLVQALFLLGCSSHDPVGPAREGVTEFHRKLNAEEYSRIYNEAGEEFRKPHDEEKAVARLAEMRRTLGTVVRAEAGSSRVDYSAGGVVVHLRYATQFEKGEATEDFVWRVDGDRPVLIGYNVTPAKAPSGGA